MMTPVREMEAAPLRCRERSQGEVGLAGNGAEGVVCAIEDEIEPADRIGGGTGQGIAIERRLRGCGGDLGGRLAASRHQSERDHDELSNAVAESSARPCGYAFGEARLECGFGGAVGEEKMLGDLVDAPARGVAGELELRLSGAEAAE